MKCDELKKSVAMTEELEHKIERQQLELGYQRALIQKMEMQPPLSPLLPLPLHVSLKYLGQQRIQGSICNTCTRVAFNKTTACLAHCKHCSFGYYLVATPLRCGWATIIHQAGMGAYSWVEDTFENPTASMTGKGFLLR